MKIAYILSSDIARYRGSTFKVKNQTEKWKELGHTVQIFSLTPDNAPALIETERFDKNTNPLIDKLIPYSALINKVAAYNPDIIYFRYSLSNATFKNLQKKYFSVIEINTDDKIEYKKLFFEYGGLKNFIIWQMNNMFRAGFLKRASGLVCVTEELAGRKSFIRFNNNITVVPNSIPLDNRNLKIESKKEGPVKLFFIGSPGLKWHGVEKLELLAREYQNEIEIHIVGMEGTSSKNIFWYGYLPEKKYLKIMSECHICVGTLSLHEKGLNEACPLKVREYLNFGFPVILGYKDTAFLKNKPAWVLELPNRKDSFKDSSVLKKVYKFCINYKNYIVSLEQVKSFIESSEIEALRLEFMKKICAAATSK